MDARAMMNVYRWFPVAGHQDSHGQGTQVAVGL